jgi:hypothetical protein
MKKYIIGLGCSWTQGEGGWPDEILKQYPEGRVQIHNRGKDDYHLRKYELENSWVNVLCRDHFPEYTPMNLGIKGIGNTAAVQQLYFCNRIDWDNSTGIIILLLSGLERWNLFNKDIYPRGTDQDDFYSNNEIVHNKYQTVWPHEASQLSRAYLEEVWSEQFCAANNLMELMELQTFAKAHNYKLMVANAFNHKNEGLRTWFKNNLGSIVDTFDWSTYMNHETEYEAFMELLVKMDGLFHGHWQGFFNFYKSLNWPAKYLTNCEGAHPTIEGYKVIAEEMAKHIKLKGYV